MKTQKRIMSSGITCLVLGIVTLCVTVPLAVLNIINGAKLMHLSRRD